MVAHETYRVRNLSREGMRNWVKEYLLPPSPLILGGTGFLYVDDIGREVTACAPLAPQFGGELDFCGVDDTG